MSHYDCCNQSHQFIKFMSLRKFKEKSGIIWEIHWNNPLFPCLTTDYKNWNVADTEQSEQSECHLVFFRDLGPGHREKVMIKHKHDLEYSISRYINSSCFFYHDWDLVTYHIVTLIT